MSNETANMLIPTFKSYTFTLGQHEYFTCQRYNNSNSYYKI